jgi:hypothetical protein
MTWTKLGAEWPDEARHLSDAAYRLHVDALCYSNRLLADLLIKKNEVRRFAWVDDPDVCAKELVAGGWWEDRGDKWFIGARFGGWQRTREQVETKRQTDGKAQRRKRLHDSGDHSECLRSCPSSPSAHDNAHDEAHESGQFSEQNRTAETEELPTEPDPDPWAGIEVAVPGAPRPMSDWADRLYRDER